MANSANDLLGALDAAETVPAADGSLAFAGKFLRPPSRASRCCCSCCRSWSASLDIVRPPAPGPRAAGRRRARRRPACHPDRSRRWVRRLPARRSAGCCPARRAGAPPIPAERALRRPRGAGDRPLGRARGAAWAAMYARRRVRRVGACPAAEAPRRSRVLSLLLLVLWIAAPLRAGARRPGGPRGPARPPRRAGPWHLPALAALAVLPFVLLAVQPGAVLHSNALFTVWYLIDTVANGSRGAVGLFLGLLVAACHLVPGQRSCVERAVGGPGAAAARGPPGAPAPRAPRHPPPRRGRGSLVASAPVAARLAFVSVVIPVYNERESVRPLSEELLRVLRSLGRQIEILFVDDGSTDGTSEILADLAAAEPEVAVVRLRRNFGKAAALMAGFREARGDAIVTIDGDLQDDPAEIPRLLDELEAGADLVSGLEARPQGPLEQARRVARSSTASPPGCPGCGLHDLNCGFKAYRARGRPLAVAHRRPVPLHPGARRQRGLPGNELAVNHRPRRLRPQQVRPRALPARVPRPADDPVHRPLPPAPDAPVRRASGCCSCVGFVICAYLTVLRIMGEGIGARPLLLLGVLLIVVGVQLLTIGLRERDDPAVPPARARPGRGRPGPGWSARPGGARRLRVMWLGTYERRLPAHPRADRRASASSASTWSSATGRCGSPAATRPGAFLAPRPLPLRGGAIRSRVGRPRARGRRAAAR